MPGVDLGRVFIPDSIEAGDYAVEGEYGLVHVRIEKPEHGPMQGFIIVHHILGDGVEQSGVQFPQPYKPRDGYAQWYRGALPQLVARLVANPTRARERFVEVA